MEDANMVNVVKKWFMATNCCIYVSFEEDLLSFEKNPDG